MNDSIPSNLPSAAELRIAFARTLPAHLERMRNALQCGDRATLQAVAHTLAGSAATFNCRRVGNAAADLDRSCVDGDLDACRSAFSTLRTAALTEAPEAFDEGLDKADPFPGAAGPLILLVDDDQLLLQALARALEQEGFRVRSADSAAQALALLHAEAPQPQLAVLDISMPGMSGLELAAQMDGVPCMFLSASGGADIVAQAAEAGAVGFLLKPIDPAQLLPAVRAGLARAAEIHGLRAAEERLALALREGRETGMAVGILMERYRIDRHGALRMLRHHARSSQRKLNDVACELLQAAEVLNALALPKPELPSTRTHGPERRR